MLDDMTSISSDEALQRLLQGNRRFVEDRPNPAQPGERVREFAAAQHPFAAVLGCSDSRVPAELVFDCSLGDLFVVRTAGHALGPAIVGSLEYAAVHLGVPLVLVLGHTRCGAIQAAVSAGPDAHGHGSIAALVQSVRPSIERVRMLPGDIVDHAVTANIEDAVGALRCAELLEPLIKAGTLRIAGARYDLDSGEVRVVA